MPAFLLRRALTVFAVAFAVLSVVSLLKGQSLEEGLTYAALWAAAGTAVFGVAQAIRAWSGASCAVCEEVPAANDGGVESHV